jgi:nucleotide-binding universal stress UspA family protein
MTVIAAVDGEEISANVVSTAYEIASGINEALVVVHVMTEDQFEAIREGPDLIGGAWDIPYARYEQPQKNYSKTDAESEAATLAEEIIAETLPEEMNATPHGAVGEPAEVIVDLAESSDANYLVIGGRKRTPVGKALFGSVSQSVLLNATCPVVSVMRDESEGN